MLSLSTQVKAPHLSNVEKPCDALAACDGTACSIAVASHNMPQLLGPLWHGEYNIVQPQVPLAIWVSGFEVVIHFAMAVVKVAVLLWHAALGSSVPADHLDAPHKWVPAERCAFANPPVVPYYWDPKCTFDNTSLGCWADGVHAECRFCGEEPYTGVHCPPESIAPSRKSCRFDEAPAVPLHGVCQE